MSSDLILELIVSAGVALLGFVWNAIRLHRKSVDRVGDKVDGLSEKFAQYMGANDVRMNQLASDLTEYKDRVEYLEDRTDQLSELIFQNIPGAAILSRSRQVTES